MGLPKLLQQIQSTYLPNSGGTVNGVITCTQPRAMEGSDSNNYFVIAATKNDAYKNSSLFLHNIKANENAGCFQLRASDGTTTKVFHGSPTGTLSWDSQNVECVSSSSTNYIRYANGLQICWV